VRHLLLAAAVHIALTIAIFLTGHFQLLPGTLDENGVGLSFAIDGATYRTLAGDLADELQSNGLRAWLAVKAPLHCRLYSLSFATVGKLLGHNVLAAEALNVLYYLGILTCVYMLGREAFDARTGLLAAAIAGAWPSFLLHSTQLIRDPLAILCFLALMVLLTLLLTRSFVWRKGIVYGIAGALVVSVFWITRGNMWNVVLVAIVVGLALLVQRMVREKKVLAGNIVVMLSIIAAALLVPTRLESTTLAGVRPPATPLAIPSTLQSSPRQGIWTSVVKQIADRRAGFRLYAANASDIDGDVRFSDAGDIVRFVPRAFVIGLFAPFPKMWVQRGNYGVMGRLVSGVETLAMYFLYVAAGVCVWRERRNRAMWMLILVATIGMIALGLVVVNAGALYRIRYVFWMMMIVIAAKGISDRMNMIQQDYHETSC
jgi:4-amino-4-deoxy-L-arabinose transferase-like glycosyltransferase